MVERKYKIKWTPRATNGYQKIIAYLVEEWSLPVAEQFIKITEGRIETLSGQPFVGKVSTGKLNTRSILVTRHNRLYYRVKKEFIELVGFYDTRQHPSKNKFEK